MYKLIAIDMDGTLLNDQHEITEEVKDALAQVQQLGIRIVLCSGRPIDGLGKYIEELKLNQEDDYVAAYNGALVQHTRTKEALIELSLAHDHLEQLYKLSVTLDTPMHFFGPEGLYTPNKNISSYTVLESFLNGIPLHYREISDIPSDSLLPKIMFIDHPKNLDQIIQELPEELYEQYTIVQSAPFFLEFMHPNAGKGNAIHKLAEKLGIKQEEVMCIGDNENDLSMIEYAGCGVAMGNAIPSVKAVADFETLSNNENGVAHAIKKLILESS